MSTSSATVAASSLECRRKHELLAKIATRTASVGVIGMGYVGLPLALLFNEEGFVVTGFDVDESKVQKLSDGESYIYRIPATEILSARARSFSATTAYHHVSELDVVVICVPTPLNDHREPDLSYIISTVENLAPYTRQGQLIILESTTYPGTTEEVVVPILETLNRSGLRVARRGEDPTDANLYVAFSPEREDPGNNTVARRDIPKVVGGMEGTATELAAALYRSIFKKVVCVSGPAIAEMTKLLENIYRCVNIAMVNELKLLCLRMNIDIWEVIEAASTKPFGFQPFYPGPGLGGHCIPLDPFYLSWKARECDFHTRFIELAGEINSAMPYHVVQSITTGLGRDHKSLNGSRVLILGVSYKKDIDDLRESPALKIIEVLQKGGAAVSYHDPFFPALPKGRKHDLQMTCASLDTLSDYDCVVIVTDHSDYDYRAIVQQSRLVIDTRNATRGIESLNIVHC